MNKIEFLATRGRWLNGTVMRQDMNQIIMDHFIDDQIMHEKICCAIFISLSILFCLLLYKARENLYAKLA